MREPTRTYRACAVIACVLLALAVGCQRQSAAVAEDVAVPDGAMWRILTSKGWGFIDSTGEIVVEPQYRQVTAFESERHMPRSRHVAQRMDGTWVLVTADGESPLYDRKDATSIYELGDELFRMRRSAGGGSVIEIIDLRENFSLPEGYSAGNSFQDWRRLRHHPESLGSSTERER